MSESNQHSTQQETPPITQLADWYLCGQLFADPANLLRQLLAAHRNLEEQLEVAESVLHELRQAATNSAMANDLVGAYARKLLELPERDSNPARESDV